MQFPESAKLLPQLSPGGRASDVLALDVCAAVTRTWSKSDMLGRFVMLAHEKTSRGGDALVKEIHWLAWPIRVALCVRRHHLLSRLFWSASSSPPRQSGRRRGFLLQARLAGLGDFTTSILYADSFL